MSSTASGTRSDASALAAECRTRSGVPRGRAGPLPIRRRTARLRGARRHRREHVGHGRRRGDRRRSWRTVGPGHGLRRADERRDGVRHAARRRGGSRARIPWSIGRVGRARDRFFVSPGLVAERRHARAGSRRAGDSTRRHHPHVGPGQHAAAGWGPASPRAGLVGRLQRPRTRVRSSHRRAAPGHRGVAVGRATGCAAGSRPRRHGTPRGPGGPASRPGGPSPGGHLPERVRRKRDVGPRRPGGGSVGGRGPVRSQPWPWRSSCVGGHAEPAPRTVSRHGCETSPCVAPRSEPGCRCWRTGWSR